MADTLEQIAERIVRSVDETCHGAIPFSPTPYCACAPNGTPLCEACEKLKSLILSALQSLARERDDLQAEAAKYDEMRQGYMDYMNRKLDRAEHALATLREAGARALREAADQMDSSESEQWTREEVRDWLLFRAARLAVQEPRQEKENASHGLRDVQPVLTPKPEATPPVCASCGREYGHAANCAMPSAPRVRSIPVCNTAGCGCVATHGRHCETHAPPESFGVDGGAVGDAREETKPATP
jgi:hypothetical protein